MHLENGNYVDVYGESTDALVFFHGGGWIGGSPKMLAPLAQKLASENLCVYAPSYRVLLRENASITDAIVDAVYAVKHLAKNGPIALGGASAGGLLALHIAKELPDCVSKLILLNPVTNTGPGGFTNRQVPEEGITSISPLSFAHRLRPVPTLMIHSVADEVVPISQSQKFLEAWKNPNALLVKWPSGRHGFFNTPPHLDPVVGAIHKFMGISPQSGDTSMPVTIRDEGENNRIDISPDVLTRGNMSIEIQGNGNHISIGSDTRLIGGKIQVRNNHSTLEIGERCVLNGSFQLRANNSHLTIGSDTTMMGGIISLHEAGTIRLGQNCMLSGGIHMDVSDMHSILDDATGKRINPPADIEIGDHVWIARSVQILKGSEVGKNCMIGACALVSGKFPDGSLLAGVPARILRSGINWHRERLPWD